MCGRYFLNLTPEKLKQLFGVENILGFEPNFNACPTQFLPIIVRGNNENRVGQARWGLLPSHASHDDMALCAKLKNARSETLLEKKSFSTLWTKGRRCIVPASGFYEWPEEKIKGHPGFHISYGSDIGFAGLWNKHDNLVTYTIITCQASSDLKEIHSRMPVMFTSDMAKDWLWAPQAEAYQMMTSANLQDGFKIIMKEKPISNSGQPALV